MPSSHGHGHVNPCNVNSNMHVNEPSANVNVNANASVNTNGNSNVNGNVNNSTIPTNAQAPQGQGSPSTTTINSDQFNPDGTYKRKDKSLGVLCVNFMLRYDKLKKEQPGLIPAVSIDEAAQTLQVERRRIYDIINILEAIHVVSRKCKNTYNWHGMDNIHDTFLNLQKEALDTFEEDALRNGFKVKALESVESNDNGSADANANADSVNVNVKPEEPKAPAAPPMPTGLAMLLASAEQVALTTNAKGYKKPKPATKEKSLGRLSQKFIQLFLVGNECIALNDASDKILGKTLYPEPPPGSSASDILLARSKANKMLKTKIRRLYDIANVMASIGLIAKLNGGNNLKKGTGRPSFKWIYPVSPRDYLEKGVDAGRGSVAMSLVPYPP